MEAEELEIKLDWTSAAAQLSEAESIKGLVLERSGELFAQGKDELATELRRFALKDIEPRVTEYRKRVQDYINIDRANR